MTAQAGSVASRAIAQLRADPRKEWTSAVLADTIDSDTTTVGACLAPHVRSGAVSVRKAGRLNFFSIGTGKPAAPPEEESDEPDEPRQRVTRAKAGDAAEAKGHASVFHAAGGVPHPTSWKLAPRRKPATKAVRAPKAAKTPRAAKTPSLPVVARPASVPVTRQTRDTPPPARSVAVALFNTGELVIEVAQQPAFRLSREQTGELLEYLQLAAPRHSAA